jgi:hypothetical protein
MAIAGAPALWLLLALTAGCSHDSPPPGGALTVPLEYAPEHARESIRPFPAPLPHTRIYVGTFDDKRETPGWIGRNTEHATPVPIRAGTQPAEFFRQTLATQLQHAGLTVVDDPTQADRTIRGDLTQFWVEESNNYEAHVGATIRVIDQSGQVKWEGAVTGKGENFGRSLSPENYREALSDAIVRLTYENLFANPGFQNALR